MDEVVDILNQIDNASIPYCVLRNYEFVTGDPLDGDVDVLVREQDQKVIDRILRSLKFYPFEGDTTKQTRYRGYLSKHREIVTIDLYWNAPTYNGLQLLDGERVLRNRRLYNGIWIPDKNDYFTGLVFHAALNKNRYREKYRAELDGLRGEVDEEAVRHHGRTLFGTLGEWAINRSLDGEYDLIISKKWKLVQAGILKSPRKTVTLVWNLLVLREIIRPSRKVLKKFVPGGSCVVGIVGPDGVGKSTAVAGITEALTEMSFDAESTRLGIHSGASPFLQVVRKLYNSGTGRSSQSSARSTGTASLSSKSDTWKVPILLIDWMGRYLRAQLGNNDVLVSDRYLHELVVYSKPGKFSKLFKIFEPTVGVVLEDDIESLTARSEFERNSVDEFLNRLSAVDWPRIQIDEDPDETVDQLLVRIVPELLSESSKKKGK